MAYADEPPCAGTDLSVAQASMVDAKKAIDASIAAIDNPSQSDLSNLATWLGVHSSSDSAIVRDKLVATRTYTDGAVFLCANSTDIGLGDIYAYVRPDNSFVIVLGIFFTQAPPTGFNSKLGTLVHEMSHFVLAGATKDIVYGIDGAKNLAATNPSAARQNADNYEYFVEATVFGLK
jgi:peptidyl-Lys metalloendopeptidase